MSKHDILTRDEFQNYRIRTSILEALNDTCQSLGLKPSECKVLDWGCGRMRGVLKLREMGYAAYGVDTDTGPVSKAGNLATAFGHDPETLFKIIEPDGHVDFPDGMFHFIYSDHVFEHVADMKLVAREISRLTAPGGEGLHIYPAKWAPWEGHLHMPFVHWLPKFSAPRKWGINLFTSLGLHCYWDVENEKDAYFHYLNTKTFYRSASEVQKIFQEYGLKTYFNPFLDERLKRPVFQKIGKNKILKNLLLWLVTTFKSAHLRHQKS